MNIPDDLRYLASHEWCRVDGDLATVGITDYAQDQLGDVVYIELPAVGSTIADRAEPFGTIESVKAASDLYSPVTGEVVEVNEPLNDAPERINEEPYGAGWLIRVKLADPSELETLLTPAAYAELIADAG